MHTKDMMDDRERDAIVCNAGWINGEIPWKNIKGEVIKNEDNSESVVMPVRGAREVLVILLKEGVIRPSNELSKMIGDNSYRFGYDRRWYV